MRRWVIGCALVLVFVATSACGGGGGDDAGGSATKTTEELPVTTAAAGKSGVPAFLGDFKRVCTTQVGFPGVAPYEAGPGIHPVVLFEDFRGEGFVQSSRSLPDGWMVKQDTNFEDTTDLEAAQLVACSDRVKEIPTGVVCTFDDDGAKVELELVNAVYEVKVYTATTGELKHQKTLEANDSECPYIATFKKGDRTYVNDASDDDYINALKTVVAP